MDAKPQVIKQAVKKEKLHSSMIQLYCRAKNSSLYSNAFYLMLNTAATSVLGFAFWNIMARSFSHADVGIGSALTAASGLVSTIAILGLGTGLVRFVPEYKEKANALINSALTLAGAASIVIALTYILCLHWFAPALTFLRTNYWFAALFILFTASTAISSLIDQSLIARRTSRYVFWKNLTASMLKLPMPVFLFASFNGFGIFAGTGTALFLSLLLAAAVFLPKAYSGYRPRPQLHTGLLKKVLPFSFCNYLAGLINGAPGYIYPIMVLNVLGPEQNAYFYMAWMIAMILTVIPGSLSQSLFAEGSHDPERLSRGGGRRALLTAVILAIPATGAIILLGGWLLHFFGPAYAEKGTILLRILAASIIPMCINSFFTATNQIKKRVPLILGQSAYLSFTSLILGYWLLERIGITGIGTAYFLAHFSLAGIVIRPLWMELKTTDS